MKKILLSLFICLMASTTVFAQYYGSRSSRSSYGTPSYGMTNSSVRYQSGYTRSNGTYVTGHYKTTINTTNHDNYSTRGNVNSYTGTMGSRARDYSSGAYNYGSGHSICTGPRGGQYYINSRGNRTYVPKRY